jgi:hypothetical protein
MLGRRLVKDQRESWQEKASPRSSQREQHHFNKTEIFAHGWLIISESFG